MRRDHPDKRENKVVVCQKCDIERFRHVHRMELYATWNGREDIERIRINEVEVLQTFRLFFRSLENMNVHDNILTEGQSEDTIRRPAGQPIRSTTTGLPVSTTPTSKITAFPPSSTAMFRGAKSIP